MALILLVRTPPKSWLTAVFDVRPVFADRWSTLRSEVHGVLCRSNRRPAGPVRAGRRTAGRRCTRCRSLVPPQPRNAHPLSWAFEVAVTRANPMTLFFWLKYVWYIVRLVVLVEVWSIRANPPSPKSARVHVPFGLYHSVPLSWVPPIEKLGSVGWTASDSNCVAENCGLFLLVHVAPPSPLLKMPPSLPAYTIEGLLGAYSVAWSRRAARRPTRGSSHPVGRPHEDLRAGWIVAAAPPAASCSRCSGRSPAPYRRSTGRRRTRSRPASVVGNVAPLLVDLYTRPTKLVRFVSRRRRSRCCWDRLRSAC